MDEFLYGLTIIILIAVVIALKRKLRRTKRGSCSKTELRIGEGITFSHTSCVNPEAEKPRAKPNAIVWRNGHIGVVAGGIVWRNGHIGVTVGGEDEKIVLYADNAVADILRDEKIVLEQRQRAISEQVSENYRLLSKLREAQAKAEWQNVTTLVEEVRRESDFSQTIQSQLSAIKQSQSILK